MKMDLQQLAEFFNGRAATYVNDAWHRRYAEQLVDATPLREGDRVLDAATGTGFAARAIARRVGPTGRVLGVDISPGMLEQARIGIDAASLTNVDLLEADVTDLRDQAAASFDAVVCCAGLLYIPVVKALRAWHRLLKAGGVIAFSTMKEGSPLAARVFRDCARRFGLEVPDLSAPLGTEERCRQVLQETGFEPLRVMAERIDYEMVDFTLAWEANLRSACGIAARALGAEEQNAMRLQYLEAVQQAVHANPAETRAEAIFAIGIRPAGQESTSAV